MKGLLPREFCISRRSRLLIPLFATFSMISALLGLTGCSINQTDTDELIGSDESVSATVRVEQGNLDVVYVSSGVVVSSVDFVVRATKSGRVELASFVESSQVQKGEKLFAIGGTDVLASMNATFLRFLVADGAQVVAGVPVAVLRVDRFAVQASIPVEEAFRVYSVPTVGTANIIGGPSGVECDVVKALNADEASGDEGKKLGIACILRGDNEVVEGLPAQVGVKTASVQNVLILPITAVQGDTQKGVVTLVKDGISSRVSVELGVSDGVNIEIKKGLSLADEVAAYAPGIR